MKEKGKYLVLSLSLWLVIKVFHYLDRYALRGGEKRIVICQCCFYLQYPKIHVKKCTSKITDVSYRTPPRSLSI